MDDKMTFWEVYILNGFREWLSDNLRYILLGLFIILALTAALLGMRFISTKLSSNDTKEAVKQEIPQDADSEDTEEEITKSAAVTPTEAPDENLLEKNAYPEVNAVIQKYYTALGSKDIEGMKAVVDELDAAEEAKITRDQYLDGYSNIEVYTKKGLAEGSYVVFACYDYKFKDIDTLVPGLSQLYVSTKEDASLYISMQGQNTDVQQYIADIMQDADVMSLIQNVQSKYDEAYESDEKLKEFIDALGVPTSSAAEAAVGDTLTVKNGCNVRAEANSDSEIIGELGTGEQVVKKGADGDWIQIDFEGQTGYVRNDMFQ